ncbi:MAG TPA: GIY-YIG nuclease family protein [Sulfurovum sp.]|uniref:GIY-YIG nuclease family protein n=1 Tax=Sulfurovum sp. TaxID=1969726 RepID=UPI002F93DAFA
MYHVYIVRCADDTLYTGIAKDLQRRLDEHNSLDKGAKYTRTRRPVTLVYSEEHPDRSAASKREYAIKKKMSKAQKIRLIASKQEAVTAESC